MYVGGVETCPSEFIMPPLTAKKKATNMLQGRFSREVILIEYHSFSI
jgi:hypothetical protein